MELLLGITAMRQNACTPTRIGGGMNTMKSIVRILATIAIVLATTLGMNAQKTDKAMEQQVFFAQ